MVNKMKKRTRTEFYKAVKIGTTYGSIFNASGELVNLKERGLDGNCEGTDRKHKWLLYPEWTESVKQGGKEYIVCLNCLEHSHL